MNRFERMADLLLEGPIPPGLDIKVGNRRGRVIEQRPDGSRVVRWYDDGSYEVVPMEQTQNPKAQPNSYSNVTKGPQPVS